MKSNGGQVASKGPVALRRAFGYVRVSDDEQAEHGLSLEVQERDILRYAEAHGIDVIDILRDEGRSAFRQKKRPGFDALLQRLDECDLVLVWKTDRFGRRSREIHNSVGNILDRDKGFISVTEGFDLTTPVGRLMFSFAAALAQYEPENMQVRILPNVQASVERGLHHGRPPYGYHLTTRSQQEIMQPHPEQAPVVRRIFAEFAAGKSLYRITTDLNLEQVPTRHHRRWSPVTVRKILQRLAYIGKVAHTRSGQVLAGLHEPLIDPGTWELCQRRLKRNEKYPARTRSGSLALMLRCGYCGSPLSVDNFGGKQSYRCRRLYLEPGLHSGLSIRGRLVEHYVWSVVEALLSASAEQQWAIQWSQQAAPPDARQSHLREQRERLEADIAYNLTAARETGLPHKILAQQNAPLQERLTQVEEELEALAIEEPRDDIPQLREKMQEARKASYERQKDYLGQLFTHIEICKRSLVFHFREEGEAPLAIRRHYTGGMCQEAQDKLPIEPPVEE